MMSYTALQLDALKEMGNIGSGNAATTLSVMLNTMVDMEVSEIALCPVSECMKSMGVEKSDVFSIIHELHGDLNGLFWLGIKRDGQVEICTLIGGEKFAHDPSIVFEVSNILGGNYIRALADMLGLTIELEPPSAIAIDDYLNDSENHGIDTNGIVFIRNKLIIMGKTIDCFISFVLTQESQKSLLNRLGVS